MTIDAPNQLQQLYKTTEIAVLKTQALLNSLKNTELLSRFTDSEVKMTVEAICFQLAQMNDLPHHCQKLRAFCANPADLQKLTEIERGLKRVLTLSRDLVLLLKKERKNLDSIIKSMEDSSINLHLFYQLSSSFY